MIQVLAQACNLFPNQTGPPKPLNERFTATSEVYVRMQNHMLKNLQLSVFNVVSSHHDILNQCNLSIKIKVEVSILRPNQQSLRVLQLHIYNLMVPKLKSINTWASQRLHHIKSMLVVRIVFFVLHKLKTIYNKQIMAFTEEVNMATIFTYILHSTLFDTLRIIWVEIILLAAVQVSRQYCQPTRCCATFNSILYIVQHNQSSPLVSSPVKCAMRQKADYV